MLYFAVLRDIIGKQDATVIVPDASTPRDVWELLRAEHAGLAAYQQPPLVAINETYATPETLLQEGDALAFIPPVAGG